LLEGLEISEVMFQYVKLSSDIFRVDSTFFKREYLKDENLIRKKNNKTLIELQNSILSFGAYSLNNHVNYLDEGVPFIRGINMKNGRIDFSNTIYINKKANELLWKSEVRPSTVLLSMSGTIGDVAIASKNWNYPINSNQDIAKIHPSKNISSYYLYAFLLTKYGQNYLKREARGSVQQHVFLSQIEKFEIPIFNNDFISKIEKLIIEFENSIELSKQSYTQAETLLLEEIGLQDFEPSKEPVNIKSFKDSYATSGRLDAEYYQPKYDDYLKLIEDYSNGSDTITTICNLNGKNFKPEDKTTYNYIELSNVGKTGDVNGCTTNLGEELPSRARRKVNTNDVIISSIEGSLDSCALITKEYDNALCSTGFYVINSKIINSETLLVLFKSELMQNVLKQNCSGTILTGMNKDDFLNINIPKIKESTQQKIAKLIEQSFSLKKQSEHLLEIAKRSVEIAIEENESVALAFIKKETA